MRQLVIIVFLTLGLLPTLRAQEIVDTYIESFQFIAISEMERTGIPASVKLAQGLLESNWGRSELAQFSHNHFGIKCGNNWTGGEYYKVDDDRDEKGKLKESCFRVFESDEASYIAHSEFLLVNKRYSFLFDYSSTDYKAWAKGLRKAGYATDPSYPSKIIGVIKKYDLARFDYMASDELEILAQAKVNKNLEDMDEDEAAMAFMEESVDAIEEEEKERKVARKSRTKKKSIWSKAFDKKDFTRNFVEAKKKWSDFVEEEKANLKSKKGKSIGFNFENLLEEVTTIGDNLLNGEIEKEAPTSYPNMELYNETAVVVAGRGETLQDIAIRTGVNVKQIAEFNDFMFSQKQTLHEGERIYLEFKATSFHGSRKMHQVKQGQSVMAVAHRYGVTVQSLRKRNYLDENEEVKPGEMLYLRGIRTEKKPKLRSVSVASSKGFIDDLDSK